MNSRKIFIWDVHWCFDELILLLEKIKITDNDKIYLTWDFINKWPKSYEVLEFLYKNKDNFSYVIWNNEVNFLKWIIANKQENQIIINELYKKYLIWNNNDLDFLQWINLQKSKNHKIFNDLYKKIKENNSFHFLDIIINSPMYIEEDNFILVHWWIIPGKKLEEHSLDEITRLRLYNNELWYKNYFWDKKIIYWHNAKDWLQIREKTIWLDSWCVYWKSLTAYILDSWEIYSQNALSVYENINK